MLNIILRDIPDVHANLLPITLTRPVADIRSGILTIREKWEHMLPGVYSYLTTDYLSVKYPCIYRPDGDNIIISSHILPTPDMVEAVAALKIGQALMAGDEELARRGTPDEEPTERLQHTEVPTALHHLYDIFRYNDIALEFDFLLLTQSRQSQPISPTNTIIGNPGRVFLEDGASMEGAIVNVNAGPVYIGRDAEVMEGTCIRGGLALCKGSQIKMGAKIYGATTIGPHCKVGGEVANSVFIGYSNKAHDGFLGNSVIGEWCNLAAGTVASNLKNDYTEVKLWNYPKRRFLRTGLQFCGLIMADHSKTGINTMLNTATVLGVGVNIHGAGYPRNFIPSFMEGSTAGLYEVPITKFLDTAERVKARRNVKLTPVDIDLYRHLYQMLDDYK